MKDKITFTLTIGILVLLAFLIVGDFTVALKESRPVDDSIINLLQVTITGLIGIIGTYFGMRKNDGGSNDDKNE